MKRLNGKGFTLIELLAVITIMGILMLVAIPAVSRTIENSRRDTFADVAKTYINTVRNSVLADEFICDGESVSATGKGTYFFKIDSSTGGSSNDIMESGGKSSWGNADVAGYVQWVKDDKNYGGEAAEGEEQEKISVVTYSIMLVDAGKHGIETAVEEAALTRAKVKVSTTLSSKDKAAENFPYPSGEGITECTLK